MCRFGSPLAVPGGPWRLPLGAPGAPWRLLAASGGCWRLLAAAWGASGGRWWLLADPGFRLGSEILGFGMAKNYVRFN